MYMGDWIGEKIEQRKRRREARAHPRIIWERAEQREVGLDAYRLMLERQRRNLEKLIHEQEMKERASRTQGQVISPKDPYGEEDWEN